MRERGEPGIQSREIKGSRNSTPHIMSTYPRSAWKNQDQWIILFYNLEAESECRIRTPTSHIRMKHTTGISYGLYQCHLLDFEFVVKLCQLLSLGKAGWRAPESSCMFFYSFLWSVVILEFLIDFLTISIRTKLIFFKLPIDMNDSIC